MPPGMMHSKTLVVDGLFSTIGSINLDTRSMSKNAEVSLSFYDRTFSGEICCRSGDGAVARGVVRLLDSDPLSSQRSL